MAVTVRVELVDTTLAANPVAGLVVRFFTSAEVFVTQGTTDALGIVDVTLPGAAYPTGVEYRVRGYKPGVSFGAPRTIKVYEPAQVAPNNNDFRWAVNVFEIENSPTPGVCRVSGPIIRADCTLAKNQRLLFKVWPPAAPNVFYGHLVAPQPPRLCELPSVMEARSDEHGIFRIDLLRGAKYSVIIPGWDEEFRMVHVPDRAGVLLADLIFPYPVQVTYDPIGPYVIHVDSAVTITPSVIFSDYNDYGAGGDLVVYSSSDLAVLGVVRDSLGRLTLTGVTAGPANLVATRGPKAFSVVPTAAFIGDTVAVTVV